MATYLLTWNPRLSDMDIDRRYRRWDWSCGLTKSVPRGSRVFVMRQVVEPRGIFASAYTTTDVYQGKHWSNPRKVANYVDFELDTLIDPLKAPILSRPTLSRGDLKSRCWDTRMSGIRIPDQIAVALERAWSSITTGEAPSVSSTKVLEGTLTEIRYYRRGRHPGLRLEALAKAKGVCAACGQDFSRVWDGRGARVLQVHHRKQMSAWDKPRLTAVADLAVVCANCHQLIHINPRQAIAVEELRRRLATDRRRRRGAVG